MVYIVFVLLIGTVFFIVLCVASTVISSIPIYYNVQKRPQKGRRHVSGSESPKQPEQVLDREIAQLRKDKVAEMEDEIAAEKKSTLEKLVGWADREEERLQKRLDQQYQAEANKTKGDK